MDCLCNLSFDFRSNGAVAPQEYWTGDVRTFRNIILSSLNSFFLRTVHDRTRSADYQWHPGHCGHNHSEVLARLQRAQGIWRSETSVSKTQQNVTWEKASKCSWTKEIGGLPWDPVSTKGIPQVISIVCWCSFTACCFECSGACSCASSYTCSCFSTFLCTCSSMISCACPSSSFIRWSCACPSACFIKCSCVCPSACFVMCSCACPSTRCACPSRPVRLSVRVLLRVSELVLVRVPVRLPERVSVRSLVRFSVRVFALVAESVSVCVL